MTFFKFCEYFLGCTLGVAALVGIAFWILYKISASFKN